MPASVVTTQPIGVPVLETIDVGRIWSGVVTYNRVDAGSQAELDLFSSNLPAPYVTQGLGLTAGMWDQVTRGLSLFRTYVNFDFGVTNGSDANYFVSDFVNPNSRDSAGIAARPGNTPILAYNVRTWDTYSDQQQAWIVLHELGHTLGRSGCNLGVCRDPGHRLRRRYHRGRPGACRAEPAGR